MAAQNGRRLRRFFRPDAENRSLKTRARPYPQGPGIRPVTDKRKLPGRELNADLMGSAGMQPDADQGKRLSAVLNRGKDFPFASGFLYSLSRAFHDICLIAGPVVPEKILPDPEGYFRFRHLCPGAL